MIRYEKHPKRSYTQKRDNLKKLRSTILASLAMDAVDTATAFSLLQDIQAEVMDDYVDFEALKATLERFPQRKKEYQETYDAVMLGLSRGSSQDKVEFGVTYPILQNIVLDLLNDNLDDLGESTNVD